jgi:Na+-driven multidrug efflux pump
MMSQILGFLIHVGLCHLFVNILECEIMGVGFASILTNTSILLANLFFTNRVEEIKEATRVGIRDPQVWKSLRAYFSLGVPSMLNMVLEFSCFEITTLLAGYLSVIEQATGVLVFNIIA